MTIEITNTETRIVPCDCGSSHEITDTTIVVGGGAMQGLQWILAAAARGQDFAANGNMRGTAGRLFTELGFGDDPCLWPNGRPGETT